MHMIDELGHETALPSGWGTNRAGLGGTRVDLATAARRGKSSRDFSFPPTPHALAAKTWSACRTGPSIPGCALTVALADNPSETMIKTAASRRANTHQFLTNSSRIWPLNPGAFLSDQRVSRVNRETAAAKQPTGALHGDGEKGSSDIRPDDTGSGP